MPNKHLPVGGSTATRTLACPGWINASKEIPKGKSSIYADEGNLLHDALENYYQRDESFEDQIARKLTYAGIELNQNHVEEILLPSVNMVEQVLDHYDAIDYICEPFVEYIRGLAGGSIDMLAASMDGKYTIILDYKTGHSPVSPTSAQLPFYALSAMVDEKTKDFFSKTERLVYVIIQPKVSHEPNYIEVDAKTLVDFKIAIDKAIKLTQSKNPPKKAGSHCQYCPATPYCDEKKAQVKSALVLSAKNATTLAQSLQLASELETWVKEVNTHAHNLMEQGAQIPGYKLVDKRALRKWKNTLDVQEKLGDYDGIYEMKLKSPAQVEKLFKKNKIKVDLDQLIEKKSSGTTVVPESDKREAVTIPEISDSLKRIAQGNT